MMGVKTRVMMVVAAATLVAPAGARAATCAEPGDNGCQGYNRNATTAVDKVCATTVDSATGSTITRIVIPGPTGTVTGMCVYLPPGYATSGLRYPVMYLLHGGLGDQADWVDKGQIRRIMDERLAAEPSAAMIVVMPDAGSNGQWANALDGSFANETYLVDVVIPAIESRYPAIDDRSGRIIEGLSNGGYGAMHLAAKHPDLFVSAGGMSSNLELPTWSANYGTPVTAPAYQAGQTPRYLAENLDDIPVILHIGQGCEQDDYVRDRCAGLAIDGAFIPMNEVFVQALRDAGHDEARLSYTRTSGEHAWKYWQRWLSGPHLDWHLARARHATASPEATRAPARWRYTSVAPSFSVWGYTISADSARAREFLTIRDVDASGLTLNGSGLTHVTTAPLYAQGATYLVDGAPVPASDDGRLSFDVNLGPAHADEEFTPAARAKQATAGDAYVTTVRVTVVPT